jgi:transcriptional regulator of acetoin/glycerol metabolism
MAAGEVLDADAIRRALPPDAARRQPGQSGGDLAATLADAERHAIVAALDESNGQKSAAAQRLGVSRSQFYEKLRRHNIAV